MTKATKTVQDMIRDGELAPFKIHDSSTPLACQLGKMECGKHNRPLVHDEHIWWCPECKPFSLSGPGWYKTRSGSWIHLVGQPSYLGWHSSGKYGQHGTASVFDIIARATPEQAAVLSAVA